MRGAKSNALLLKTANRNPGCPCVALVPNSSNIVLGKWETTAFSGLYSLGLSPFSINTLIRQGGPSFVTIL
jgi:hypothetical protein